MRNLAARGGNGMRHAAPQLQARRASAFARFVRCGFFGCALLLAWSGNAWPAARFAVATGNWNATSTWSATSGGAAGASVPVAGDDVTIGETTTARTVTIPAGYAAAASSVVLATTAGVAGAKALTLAANTSSLTVSGNLTVNKPGANFTTNALNVNAGAVTVNGIVTLGGTTAIASRIAAIVITTGTLTIGSDLVLVAGLALNNVINMSSSTGTINLAGAFTATAGAIQNPGTSIFNYNGTSAQTVRIGVSSIFYPNLHLNNTSATGATLSAAISATNVTGNVRVQSGILNNGGFAMAGGGADTFEVAAGARFNLTGTSAMASGFGTRTFAATSTVNYQGGAQPVASGLTYGILILSGAAASTKTPAGGTITVAGDFTLGAATTYAGNTNNPAVNLAGNFSNSGTFTSGAGAFTFNGAAAQTLTGVTTFTRMTVNNSAGLNLASNITVTTAAAGVLTLTSGNITTGANTLITARACNTPSVARTSGHVVGNLRKAIPAGASTCTFEIGSGANYTPVVAVFVAGTGAGNITASTMGTEHASIAASAIDSTKSVNRYWTLTNGGVTLPAAGFTATFNYINGSPVDFDAIATPANFMVERWDGTNWFPTTLNAACTSTPGTNLCKQVNGLTAFGEFAIGETFAGFNPNPGAFNVFETTTTAGSVLGRLFTERLGAGTFAVAIVAVLNNAVNPAPSTAALTVDIIDASPTGGTLTASSNCRTTWTTVIQTQTVSAAVAWVSGRVNVNITAPVQAVRNARIRVTQGANVGCSTDNFAIRPQAFTVTSTNATQTNTSGTPAIKTGANFNLTAASVAGYDGAPSIDNTQVVGTPTAGTLGGSFGAAPVATGTATGASFFYSEAGNFGLNANAVFDSSFTSVDQPNDCTADFSNTLVGGRYGCSFGSTAIAQTLGASGFGRFIPDNFTVSLNTPQFATGCGTFTYVGKTFSYATVPEITVTARNGANNGLTNAPTTNYAGAYMKLSNTAGTSLNQAPYDTQGGRYSRFDALGGGLTPALDPAGLPATTGDPAIGTFTAGVGTLTFGSGTGLAFARSTTTPNAPFNADIALALNVIDADGVAYAANPASFGAATSGNGIGFSNGKVMRFGRLRLFNANGSQLIAMPIAMQTQYWNGSGFVLNPDDSCTNIALTNVALGNYQKNLNAGETLVSGGGTFIAGIGTLRLSAPGAANNGSVDVAVNLTGGAAGASCTPGMPASTGSNLTHLQGLWCTPPGTYVNDPTARATFGLYKDTDQRIYQRENY